MPRPARIPPRAHTTNWPTDPCSDPTAEVIRQIAINLSNVVGNNSVRSVAKRAGVEHSVMHDILAGNTWPEVATVARIELGLRVRLWPTGDL